jgi:hypothetical protein
MLLLLNSGQGVTETKQTGALKQRQQLQHFALDEESGFDQLAQPLPQFCAPIRLDRLGLIRHEAAGAFPFERGLQRLGAGLVIFINEGLPKRFERKI